MSRFDDLIDTVETYQDLAAENYKRIRGLAEELRDGLCNYLDAKDGACVHLVPPAGPFEPKAYGDNAYSLPPRGFRPLDPIAFGVAVRVSRGTDWLRVAMDCRKIGEAFIVQIENGAEYEFELPLTDAAQEPFYAHVYEHVLNWFASGIERYKVGDYGTREIGFDFADELQSVKV